MRPRSRHPADGYRGGFPGEPPGQQLDRDLRSCKTSTGRVHLQMMRSPGGFRREVQPRRQHWFLNEKSGFQFGTPDFCSVSRGRRRLGEKEYRAPSVTPGVALRPRTQALPVAGLAAAFNGLRTIMDRRSILDGVARGSGATRATAFVAARQITPQGLGLLSGPIDEGVDCLAADGPQPRFVPGFQPTGDLFGRPPLGEPITHEQT